ncbi:MAG: hypothetical protein ACUVXI_02690 [bacterium]
MTLVIGAHLPDYTVLAADTMTTYEEGGRRFFEGGHHKIISTGFGLVTGVGLTPILDSIKQILRMIPIRRTDQLRALIREKTEGWMRRLEQKFNVDPKGMQYWNTGFVLTYLSGTEGEPEVKLSVISPRDDYALVDVGEGEVCLLMPLESSANEGERYRDFLRSQLKHDPSLENVRENLELIEGCFREIARRYPSVSADVDIGILFALRGIYYTYYDGTSESFALYPIPHHPVGRLLTPDILTEEDLTPPVP